MSELSRNAPAATLIDTSKPSATTSINTAGAMVGVQAAAPKMFARGSRTILITGGGYALRPIPNYLSLSLAGDVTTAKDATAVGEQFWRLKASHRMRGQ